MPFVQCTVNIPVHKSDLGKEITDAIVTCLNKPQAVTMVDVQVSEGLMFAGSSEPCAIVQIHSIGGALADVHSALAEAVMKQGIPLNRIFINFAPHQASEWAFMGKLVG